MKLLDLSQMYEVACEMASGSRPAFSTILWAASFSAFSEEDEIDTLNCKLHTFIRKICGFVFWIHALDKD
jgi:hypothetical protein